MIFTYIFVKYTLKNVSWEFNFFHWSDYDTAIRLLYHAITITFNYISGLCIV